ncbi:hypothetical protein [Peterkaempfera griseoplana]|uniref:hypothetical protein n=1 Tax=Peterkaempfera griseoplana TaxID=66896 RepID=UPI0006E17D4E|nr:hypothetical protein [Peterkaempfera griseoplana]
MRAAAARLRARLGWRGASLLVCGVPWVVYGVGLLTTPRVGVSRAAGAITSVVSLCTWGWIWMLCGLLAIAAALLRPGRDVWGFAAAAGPPLIWALAYITAGATGDYRQAWASVPLLLVPVGLLVIVAVMTKGETRGG